MYELRGRHNGRRLLLPVQVLRPAPPTELDGIEIAALVDTGATNSGITPHVVEQLGLETSGKRIRVGARTRAGAATSSGSA